MAFEKELIASMNNPAAAKAWGYAHVHFHKGESYRASVREQGETIRDLRDKNQHWSEQNTRLLNELRAAREENIALHKDLGEVHDYNVALMATGDKIVEVYLEAREAGRSWERIAKRTVGAFAFVIGLEMIGLWGDLLARMS